MIKNYRNIDGISVSNDLHKIKFTCDLEKCKGACCTMESEYGAPIHESEIKIIEDLLPAIWDYLPKKSQKEIKKNGFHEFKEELHMIRSVNNRDCVFVYYDNSIAKCAIEKAYYEGKVDYVKPISCHLFPIRISDFGGPVLRYEEYSECKDALIKGLNTNLSVAQFCALPLERAFGKDWKNKILEDGEK